MKQNNYNWEQHFLALFGKCVQKYQDGNHDYQSYYSESDLGFLRLIGYREREFFDFVEDFAEFGDPSPGSALLIAAARRDYFLYRMGGSPSKEPEVTAADLPSKTSELEGMVWLPRILAKARGKLQGNLHPDVMFCCGGDRNFLRTHDISPADFLRTVWSAETTDDPDATVAKFVKSVSKA